MPTTSIEFETRHGRVHQLPSVWTICHRCDGNGTHDHPAFSNGITSSEWEQDWDEEEREHYLRGAYDVQCEKCHGSGKVLEVDRDRVNPRLLVLYDNYQDQVRIMRFEVETERRMGA
jgi:excinuclease UvrABC ATPase subunit